MKVIKISVKEEGRPGTAHEPASLKIIPKDSLMDLRVRLWINDPKNGIGHVKDEVFLAVWDSFHANDIEIAFPQRDLHIKSAVPLHISKGIAEPAAEALPGGGPEE